jgi:hypothetical protein
MQCLVFWYSVPFSQDKSMAELEDLKIQLNRAQAMILAQQQLLSAICGHSENFREIMKTFDDLYQRSQASSRLELNQDDLEINDAAVAHNVLLDYVAKTKSYTNSGRQGLNDDLG